MDARHTASKPHTPPYNLVSLYHLALPGPLHRQSVGLRTRHACFPWCTSRQCVRVAKEMDSKSIGLCPQGFESPRCRLCDPVFFPISTILPCTWPAMPGRGSDSRSASGLRPRLSQQVIAMAVIAQLVARRSHNPKVVSSILTHRIFSV